MQRKLTIIFLLTFLAFCGCAPSLSIKEIRPGKEIYLSESEPLVFGKIAFIENGEEKVPYSFSWWRQKPIPSIFHIESEKQTRCWSLEENGNFYWVVPTGTYIIPNIEFGYIILPQVAFQVPLGADAFYLGTLRIDVEIKRVIGAYSLEKKNSITIIDEFDREKGLFIERNPYFAGKIERNLMIHDSSIPIDTRPITKRAILEILNAVGFGLLIQYNIQNY